jgi:hypothetical protein
VQDLWVENNVYDRPRAARSRWEHESVLETVQARLDHHPEKMTMRRSTVEHPFGTIKCWMGATHFLTRRLPKVATEMALNVLAYNIKRVMALIGVTGLLEASFIRLLTDRPRTINLTRPTSGT